MITRAIRISELIGPKVKAAMTDRVKTYIERKLKAEIRWGIERWRLFNKHQRYVENVLRAL